LKKQIKLAIKDIPVLDRPYEKYLKYGAEVLSDSELLAILIKNGTKDINCLDLAKQLLSEKSSGLSGFNFLNRASLAELMQFNGIGKVKAIQIKALVELAKRMSKEKLVQSKILSPKDVYTMLYTEMAELEKEEIKLVILDSKNYVKSVVTVAKGSINAATVTIKELLSEPIKQLASGIILVHNHPSGDTTPSRQDILLTQKVSEYALMFDIILKDHIIIGKNGYTSLRETNDNIFIKERLIWVL